MALANTARDRMTRRVSSAPTKTPTAGDLKPGHTILVDGARRTILAIAVVGYGFHQDRLYRRLRLDFAGDEWPTTRVMPSHQEIERVR